MGIVWEAYHKGVPLLGIPENPTENVFAKSKVADFFLHPKNNYSFTSLTSGSLRTKQTRSIFEYLDIFENLQGGPLAVINGYNPF